MALYRVKATGAYVDLFQLITSTSWNTGNKVAVAYSGDYISVIAGKQVRFTPDDVKTLFEPEK